VLAQQSGPSAPDQLTAAAAAAADRGDYEQAIQLWQQLEQTYRSSGDASLRVGLLLKTAAAYRAIGHQRRALQDLQTAAELAADQPALLAAVDSELGQLYFQTGNWQQAGQHFAASADAARTLGDRRLQAAVLNDQGTLAGAQGDYQNALGYFQSSLPLARSINDATLVAKILINTARVRLMLQDYDAAAALLSEALAVIDHLPASADKARSLISAGKLWQALANQHPPLAQQALTTAVTSIRTAAELADSLGDQRSAAYAWGYLGQIYE
jgi:tetratricopeptide (TPR) repeat protein